MIAVAAGRPVRAPKSQSLWWAGVAGQLMWPIAVEWLLQMAQRPVTSQDDEWQVPAAAVIGLDEPDRLHPACC